MPNQHALKWTSCMTIAAVIVIFIAGALNMTTAVLTALVAVFVGIIEVVLRNLFKK